MFDPHLQTNSAHQSHQIFLSGIQHRATDHASNAGNRAWCIGGITPVMKLKLAA
ncbi:MAG: hypothetical protein AAED33_11555 [Paracoccaceae bacterium]